VVGKAEDGQAEAVRLEHGRGASALLVEASADVRDPGRRQVLERVQQRFLAEVERVVVGERDAVDAE
jgi:hypothetical protein